MKADSTSASREQTEEVAVDFNKALLRAARRGDADAAKEALLAGGDIECRLSATADTPLMMAAYHGHIDALQLLIGHRSDINAVSSCGQTALMLAAMKGHKECMINLLNRDAKIDLRSKNGFTALILAAQRYRHECIYILLQNGANVNAVADNGMTALHAAAIKNDADCTKVLLRANADVSIRDANNYLAKDYAKKDVKKFFDTSTKAYQDAVRAQPTVPKPTVTVAEASARRSVFKWQKNGGVHKLKREYKIKDGALVKR